MCTLEKRGRVYLLILTGDGEHRLNPTILGAMRSALAQVRSDFARDGGRGAALITAAEGKYFSNGLDGRVPLVNSGLESVVADLFSLPMPTIAAVTGHAAGTGWGLALCHDYVLMRRDRGYLYMSELDIGVPISPKFMPLFRSKVTNRRTIRDVVLRGAKITADMALEMGIIDGALGSAGETVEAALRLGEDLAARNWDGRVYASIRSAAFPEVLEALVPPPGPEPKVETKLEGNKAIEARL